MIRKYILGVKVCALLRRTRFQNVFLKKSIGKLTAEYRLLHLFNWSTKIDKNWGKGNFVCCDTDFSFPSTVRQGYVDSILQYEKAINKLAKGLSMTALMHLYRILQRANMFAPAGGGLRAANLVYNKKELEKLSEIVKLSRGGIPEDGGFRFGKYWLPIDHFEDSVFCGHNGCGMPLNDGVIIDAGAFIGDSALMFRELYPKNKVVSFEPTESVANQFRQTMKKNNCDNVDLVQAALTDKNGFASLHIVHEDNLAANTLRANMGGKELKVATMRLDDYVDEHGLKVALIKTDVEGAEKDLLLGARKTIEQQRPVLAISIYHSASDFFTIKPLLESWATDYEYDFFKGVSLHIGFEIMLIARPRNK